MKTFVVNVDEVFAVSYAVEAESASEAEKTVQNYLNDYLKGEEPELPVGLERTDHAFISAKVNFSVK